MATPVCLSVGIRSSPWRPVGVPGSRPRPWQLERRERRVARFRLAAGKYVPVACNPGRRDLGDRAGGGDVGEGVSGGDDEIGVVVNGDAAAVMTALQLGHPVPPSMSAIPLGCCSERMRLAAPGRARTTRPRKPGARRPRSGRLREARPGIRPRPNLRAFPARSWRGPRVRPAAPGCC